MYFFPEDIWLVTDCNTKYLKLVVHKDVDMVPLGPGERSAVNQDATVKLIGWAGNLTCSNRRQQGIITA